MKRRFNVSLILIAGASLAIAACSSDNGGGGNTDASTGGESGSGGSSSGGKTSTGGGGTTSTGGKSSGGSSSGGTSSGGSGGTSTGGTGTGGKTTGPDGGTPDSGGPDAGVDPLLARGKYLVNSVALCGGCHTDRTKPNDVLGGNATFVTGLPAPNLTSDATGLGSWTDAQIKDAFRNGVDSDGKPLSPTMPYQLFHNLSDADADAIVAYLRSLPHVANAVPERTVTVTAAATPFALSDFPKAKISGPDGGTEVAEANAGFYLLSSAAQCVKCHSPTVNKLPDLGVTKTFTGGAPNPNATPANLYAPNITPDTTGIAGWVPEDIVTLLKKGIPLGGTKVCGMPVGPTGGYGGLTDADAHAIGVYLTNIPAIANNAADPKKDPACP